MKEQVFVRGVEVGGGESKDLRLFFGEGYGLVGQGFNPDNHPIPKFLEINPRDEVAIKPRF